MDTRITASRYGVMHTRFLPSRPDSATESKERSANHFVAFAADAATVLSNSCLGLQYRLDQGSGILALREILQYALRVAEAYRSSVLPHVTAAVASGILDARETSEQVEAAIRRLADLSDRVPGAASYSKAFRGAAVAVAIQGKLPEPGKRGYRIARSVPGVSAVILYAEAAKSLRECVTLCRALDGGAKREALLVEAVGFAESAADYIDEANLGHARRAAEMLAMFEPLAFVGTLSTSPTTRNRARGFASVCLHGVAEAGEAAADHAMRLVAKWTGQNFEPEETEAMMRRMREAPIFLSKLPRAFRAVTPIIDILWPHGVRKTTALPALLLAADNIQAAVQALESAEDETDWQEAVDAAA
jgi:hypothetical protein